MTQKLGPCPYDKKPCPGTREGCLSWGAWQDGTRSGPGGIGVVPIIHEGCRVFKLKAEDMAVAEPKPAPKPKAKPKPKPKRKAAKK
jgi:hypothetical protein